MEVVVAWDKGIRILNSMRNLKNQMRHLLAVLMLLASAPLFAQEDCDVFNIQELSAAYLEFFSRQYHPSVRWILRGLPQQWNHIHSGSRLHGSGSTEYDASANTDDGSCDDVWSLPERAITPCRMDGYTYGVVQIGDQCWFAENLRTTVYADDSSIPEVTGSSAWSGLSTGARCDYNNDASNVAAYGRLYNWYAVTNAAGLCPNGWHVPTDGEWTALEDYITAKVLTEPRARP